jgi:TRAP-type uncharacterized transport system substrate-binding protein
MNFTKYIVASIISLILVIAMALHFLVPAPPRKIVIATGSKTGQYYRLGNQYKTEFEKNGIQVEVLVTKGSVENLDLINDPKSKVDLAFIQSGTSNQKEYPNLESLAGVFYEPLWVVYRASAFKSVDKPPEKIEDISKKRVSIGVVGSGTRNLVEKIFALDNISTTTPNILGLSTDESLAKIKSGDIDVMFLCVNDRAEIMQKIFLEPNLKMMSLAKAYGYPTKVSGLNVINVKRATLNITNDSPDRDILLISPTAELVARKDIHPAIVSLLIDISHDLLSKSDILSEEKHFPSPHHLNFDNNDDAQKVMRDGPSFLHRYLPFWVAVWVDRLLRVLIPMLAILIPVFNFLPSLITYRTKLKFALIYKELKSLESVLQTGQFNHDQVIEELNKLQAKAMSLRLSQMNNKGLYDLLGHIGDCRGRIDAMSNPTE